MLVYWHLVISSSSGLIYEFLPGPGTPTIDLFMYKYRGQ